MESESVGAGRPSEPGPAAPLQIVTTDDLARSRLTVFFRLLLALPHLIFLTLWGIVMIFVAIANWVAVVFTARPIAEGFIARFLRYFAHVNSYFYLGANPFPGFTGERGSYPVELEFAEADRQSRWSAFFRLILAVPALLLAGVLGSTWFGYYGDSGSQETAVSTGGGAILTAAILGWFVSLTLARMAQGLRDLIVYAVGYLAQTGSYLLLRSDRYPNSDPLLPGYPQPAPDHPIRIAVNDDLRRSRLTVFFRLLLVLPHLIWLNLWGIVVFFTVIANWFVTLFAGRPAEPLHRFHGAYVRYATHVLAYLFLIANPFPGFTGKPGTFPIDLHIPPRGRQNRWKTGFRLILAIPAAAIAGAVGVALYLVAIFGWFVGVLLGRMPQGLRNLGAFALRYNAQTWAYVVLLTDRYPFAGPSLELLPAPAAPTEPTEPEPLPA